MSTLLPLLLLSAPVLLAGEPDSVATYHTIAPVSVNAPLKQRGELFGQPLASTSYNLMRMEGEQINTQKDFSLSTPNLYMPDYGSKMTSSIYIRGIGARMEQPSMGLYLDNVPILNKNNYEFEFYDLRRADIMRGPQSTLYGRNSIGGVINIFTLSPFDYQGIRAWAGYGNGNTADVRASVYQRSGERFGWSVSASHHSSDGFFTNEYDGSHADKILSEGVRIRLQWNISERLFIDNTLSVNYVDQKGFAYAFYDVETGISDDINHNDPCKYRRTGVVNGTTVRYDAGKFTFQSVTSYQFLDDKMTMDQDFLPVSMFTLVQAQKEHAVTQEIIFRSNADSRRWHWLTGAFGFYKHNRMNAPVTFLQDGIDNLIVANANKGLQMIFPGEELFIRESEFEISSHFRLPTYGLAAFHQSSYDLGRWRFTAGVRLDYEHVGMTYDNYSAYNYMYTAVGPYFKELASQMHGKESLSYLEVLPRIAAMYNFHPGNAYAIVTRGYKAGGINTQIFSDVLQNKMAEDLIVELDRELGLGMRPAVNDINITYEPESSWNYEVGTHLVFLDKRLQLELAAFYIDCRNQQITVFPTGQGTGRMMSNAGKSRSYGAELSAVYSAHNFRLEADYGFTDARFIEYDDNQNDYSGNKVPYAPRNTAYLAGEYHFFPRSKPLDRVTVRADWRGAGKMYWNEDNTASQGFYGLLGGGVSFMAGPYTLDLWVKNITGKEYDTFYFKSIGNTFVQKGKPRSYGLSLRFAL